MKDFKTVMKNIYTSCLGGIRNIWQAGNLVVGANIAGFLKVADAMVAHGLS